MADEKKPIEKPAEKPSTASADPFVEIVWIIFGLLVAVYLINGFVVLLNSGTFSLFGFGISNTGKSIPLSEAPTLLGGKVETTENVSVFSAPGINKIAVEPANSKATIIEGPVSKDGVKYWHVRFDNGIDGWVLEDSLNYLRPEKEPFSKATNQLGERVFVSKSSAPVYSEPGMNQITVKKLNAGGRVVDGPVIVDDIKYWKVYFDDGTEGWASENDLGHINIKPVPLSEVATIVGGQVVVSSNEANLYSSPGNGKIGAEKKGNSGKIIEGPVIRNGVKYWYIKFDDGKEGWVSENDLAYIEGSEANIGTKTSTLFKKIFSIFKYISFALSLLLAWLVFYLHKKVSKLREDEHKLLYVENTKGEELINPKWEKIVKDSESPNESDWRLAILEADIMLEALLDNLGLQGETMSDKLKAVEKSDFTTIDYAWEGHKIRNQIAHDGIAFTLSQHEARRVIGLYQAVFNEFQII